MRALTGVRSTSRSLCSCIVILMLVFLILQCIVIIFDRYGESTREMICGSTTLKTMTQHGGIGEDDDEGNSASPFETTGSKLQREESSAQQQQQQQNIRSKNNKTATSSASKVLEPGPPKPDPVVFEGVKARAFDSWPADKTLPCFKPEADWAKAGQSPSTEGFIFMKTYKTGSSTSSGINLRLARNVARRAYPDDLASYPICKSRFDHTWASAKYGNRDPDRSFVWSILRHPSTRVVSQFFHFQVSRMKVEPSDANFLDYVRNGPIDMIRDYYVGALSLPGYIKNRDKPLDISNRIMKDYDFIAITERMDESMVVLSMLLGVPIADILYLTAKGHGGWDDAGGRSGNVCTYIWPAFQSEGMKQYLESDEWKAQMHWDYALYQAANRSLDLTIDRLGRQKVEHNLKLYEHARELSRERCLHKVRFPCDEGGNYFPHNATDCLWKDSACGSDCLDEIADELDLW